MVKPRKTFDRRKVKYDKENWRRFREFREKTGDVLRTLKKYGIDGHAHGSVARGDVNEDSDIDIIIPHHFSTFRVEVALTESGLNLLERKIVMATPWQLPKAHIYLEDEVMVTVPLERPQESEEDFYHFGGAVTLEQVEDESRVPGVDKRLVLIEPTDIGHTESQVIGREGEVAKKIGVSLEIVEERIEVLTRRDKVGKTGIFLERELTSDESFESVWSEIKKNNPEVSKRKRR